MALDLLYCLLGLPFFAGVMVTFGGPWTEKTIARLAMGSAGIYGILAFCLVGMWIWGGGVPLDIRVFDLYHTEDCSFPVAFFIDSMSIAFISLVAFLSNIVIKFSSYYLHREPGYQKFFGCLLFLMFGLTLLSIAGTIDLLMAGWEFVGICSFLLISFYQTRLNSARNAFKVLSVYKFCDVGLLLGSFLCHRLSHELQFFSFMSTPPARAVLAGVASWQLLLLSVMILIAAAGKSAQWPFSFWISRAMEGPTPSSAIFYGALSVHAGVLLLHRMHPIWSAALYGPLLVGGLGITTAIACTGIGRVQSNIKGQIAYSSAANVGIMFVEMALNLPELAMVHMVTNACLRCYQLLVSPSVMSYLLRLQGRRQAVKPSVGGALGRFLPKNVVQSIYVFCMNDGFLEETVGFVIWNPVKRIGAFLQSFDRFFYWVVFPLLFLTIGLLRLNVHEDVRELISVLSALLTLGLAASAFAEKKSAVRAWNAASISALFAGLTVLVVDPATLSDIAIYAGAVMFFWVVGLQSLVFMSEGKRKLDLSVYSGMGTLMPGGSVMLFISVLGVSGFPISPAYIGQDLLLHHAASEDAWLIVALASAIVINGVSLARIYLKVCMGDPMERVKSEYSHSP